MQGGQVNTPSSLMAINTHLDTHGSSGGTGTAGTAKTDTAKSTTLSSTGGQETEKGSGKGTPLFYSVLHSPRPASEGLGLRKGIEKIKINSKMKIEATW